MSFSSLRMPLCGAVLACAASAACLGPAAAAQATPLPNVAVAVTSNSATVTGALESGAANLVVTDTGVKEGSAIFFLLKPGVTVAQAETFVKEKRVKGDPNNTVNLGAIVADLEAENGKTSEAQVNLQPGTYLLLVGAGEGEAQIRTHFTVAASKAPVALPTAEAKERSIEFGFRGPTTLHDGELVAFENEGFLVHMDVAFPVKNMKSAKKALKLLKAGNEKALGKLIAGPPVGFAGPVSHEALQQETITAKPGIYVQACFMQTQDGRDHVLLGMERIIKITK